MRKDLYTAGGVRLQKVLAQAGVASRRAADRAQEDVPPVAPGARAVLPLPTAASTSPRARTPEDVDRRAEQTEPGEP